MERCSPSALDRRSVGLVKKIRDQMARQQKFWLTFGVILDLGPGAAADRSVTALRCGANVDVARSKVDPAAVIVVRDGRIECIGSDELWASAIVADLFGPTCAPRFLGIQLHHPHDRDVRSCRKPGPSRFHWPQRLTGIRR